MTSLEESRETAQAQIHQGGSGPDRGGTTGAVGEDQGRAEEVIFQRVGLERFTEWRVGYLRTLLSTGRLHF